MEERQSRRLVIDFIVEFPNDYDPNFVAAAIRDYIHLCRFTVGLAEVSIYPASTKIVQHALDISGEMPKTTH